MGRVQKRRLYWHSGEATGPLARAPFMSRASCAKSHCGRSTREVRAYRLLTHAHSLLWLSILFCCLFSCSWLFLSPFPLLFALDRYWYGSLQQRRFISRRPFGQFAKVGSKTTSKGFCAVLCFGHKYAKNIDFRTQTEISTDSLGGYLLEI